MADKYQITSLIIVLYVVLCQVWILYKDYRNSKRKKKEILVSRNKAIYVWIINSLTLAFFVKSIYNNEVTQFNYILGLSVLLFGAYIKLQGFRILGNQYNEEILRYEDRDQLIKNNIYAIIRHPMRVGLFLEFLGLSIYSNSAISLLLVFLLFIIQIKRNKIEDEFLLQHFGLEAKIYQQNTPSVNILKGISSYIRRNLK